MTSARPSRGARRALARGPARPVRPAAPVDLPLVEVEVGPVAHGGHCVARHEGRVIFVRHALPGERVSVRLTQAGADDRFWRGDAEEVLEASADRVTPAWPEAGPGGVGGAELSHVALPAQREWKATVVAEQLARLARLDREVTVEAAPGDDGRGGLAWRTRIDLVADDEGRAGMVRHRSHDVQRLRSMPLATAEVVQLARAEGVFSRRWRPGARLELVAPANKTPGLLLVDGVPGHFGTPDTRPHARRSVVETVEVAGREYTYRVAADGFWQVHRDAPGLLAATVVDAVGDVAGGRVVDLFAGAGLFSAPLADAVGAAGRVVAVEGDERAVRDARRSLHDAPHVELHVGDVARTLAAGEHGAAGGADVVVLDPPRAGAGRRVIDAIVGLAPRRVVYVACDPAALARDVGLLGEAGYALGDLRAFDLFPMTHHVECVAVLDRA